MGEYYCTRCGADLDAQDDFDPTGYYWVCTECNEVLINPGHIERYDSVNWYCDNCRTLLNKQKGFSDWHDTWTCTECNHVNNISEEQIVNDLAEDWLNLIKDLGRLNNNKEKEDENICNDSEEDDYAYGEEWMYENPRRCKICDRLLNKQADYNDWLSYCICEKCGAYNEWTDSKEDDFGEFNKEDKEQEYEEQVDSETTKHYAPIFNKRKSHGLLKILLYALILFGGIIVVHKYYEYQRSGIMEISSSSVIGSNYEQIVAELENAGFTNIYAYPVFDLELENVKSEYEIEGISVQGENDFEAGIRYPYDVRIEITYHAVKNVYTPVSSRAAKKMSFRELENVMKEAGFVNISFQVEYDILTGWIIKDGSVKAMTIDGQRKYEEGAVYRPDVDVVIIYHTFRKNKL